MVLRALRLTNYRRFRRLELEFPENVIGIIGRNGMGKTTIVEAIGWALYGTRTARRTDKHEMRSQFASDGEACEAELEFVCGGHEYRVVRRLKGKNAIAEAALYRAGRSEPEAIQERGVNEFVERLTGLDIDSFLVSVFARQKELDRLSELQPEVRRRAINRLINIDRIDRARERVRQDRNSKRDYLSGLRATVRDRDALEAELKQFEDLATERRTALRSAKETLATKEEEVAKANANFEEVGRLRDRYQELESERRRLEERRKQLQDTEQRHLRAIAEIEASQRDLETLRPQLQTYEEVKAAKEKLDAAQVTQTALVEKERAQKAAQLRLREAQKRQNALEAAQRDLQPAVAQLKQVDSQIQTLEQQIEKIEQELRQIEGELTSLRDQFGKERKRRQQIVDLGPDAPCPTCTRPLRDHYDRVLADLDRTLEQITQRGEEKKAQKKQTQERLHQAREQLKQLRQTQHELLRKAQQAASTDEQLAQTRSDLSALTADLERLQEEILGLGRVEYDAGKHAVLRQRFEELMTLREQALKHEENVRRLPDERQNLAATQAALEDTRLRLGDLSTKLTELGYDEAKWQQTKTAVDEARAARDAAKDRVHASKQALLTVEKDVERVKAEIAEQKRLANTIKEVEDEIHYYDLLDDHLGRFRLELAGRLRPLIAHRASELLRLTSASRYSVLELDEDYNIFLYDGTERFALARFSGGEQDLANLCLRVAISQVVADRTGANPINFIVLDEIFGSQDEERKALILHALQQLSSQFRQVFVITHVEGIKDVLPVLVSVEEVNGGESRARMV